MASTNLETARRAIGILSDRFGIRPEQLEKNIVSVMSDRLENASDADRKLWGGMETAAETPTADEMIAFIVDTVQARNPEKKKITLLKEISRACLLKGRHR